jgi:hypothetical protein
MRSRIDAMTVEDARQVLLGSGVVAFVPRDWPTLTEWRAMSPDERRVSTERRVSGPPTAELDQACAAIRLLGERGDTEATPILVRLFEGHPDRRVRLAAAHALAGIDDPRAHAALDGRWADADSTIATIAVRAAVFRDLTTVWQRFRAPVQAVLDRRADTPVEEQVVITLFYVCRGTTWPRTIERDADPLVVEPRLVDLAARLRHHEHIGASARDVLALVPAKQAVTAIERYPYEPVLPRAALPEHRDFLARYLDGERGVWNELVEQAVAVAQHPDLREEAHAVATEIMKRVRHNADVVRAVLREAGAAIADEEPPAGDVELARVTSLFGSLPIALDAFWRVAGSVSLAPAGSDQYHYGDCTLEAEGLSLLALDPLEVHGPRGLTPALDEYVAEIARSHREIVGPFSFDFAPDFLHKQGISGGPPYSLELPPPNPADAVDPRVREARHRLRFVEYLRHCFRWGGFCVLEVAHRPIDHIDLNDRIAFKRIRGDWGEAADRLLQKLRADLVDF